MRLSIIAAAVALLTGCMKTYESDTRGRCARVFGNLSTLDLVHWRCDKHGDIKKNVTKYGETDYRCNLCLEE
jgi:hypothetical protein